MTRRFLLEDWVTIRTRSVALPIRQDPDLWLDLEGFKDVHVWIDASDTPASLNEEVECEDDGDDDEPPEVPPPPPEKFSDTLGLVYDDDAATHFLHVTTGIARDVVEKFMTSKARYELGLGLWGDDEELDGATPTSIRADHRDLFPWQYIRGRYLSWPLERRYIERDAGLDGESIARLQDANHEYMRRKGIVE
jgi:hypothetical protein